MATNLLEKADARYKEFRQRRQALMEEQERLLAEARHLEGEGRTSERRYANIGQRLRDVEDELGAIGGPFREARRLAGKAAAGQMLEDPEYRKLVRAAALALGASLPAWAALTAVTNEAREAGVALAPLPTAIIPQPKAAHSWLDEQQRLGVLTLDDLPPALQALFEGEQP